MSRLMELATREDFPAALGNAMTKNIIRGYDAQSFWFEHLATFTHGTSDYSLELERYFSLSWDDLLNDDLGAFTRQVKSWGVNMKREVNAFVAKMLNGYPCVEKNKLSVENLCSGLVAIMNDNNKPEFLVVPPQLWLEAVELTRAFYLINDKEFLIIPIRNDFLTEPQAWYVFAKLPAFEVFFDSATYQPTIETMDCADATELLKYRAWIKFNCRIKDKPLFYKSNGGS